jgi:hypothetical protein
MARIRHIALTTKDPEKTVLSQSSIFGAKSNNWVLGIQWLRDSQTLEEATLRQNPPSPPYHGAAPANDAHK